MPTLSRSLKPVAGALLVLYLLAGIAPAVTSDIESRVHEYDLKNGLHIIVYVDSSAPVVTTSVFYKVGSYDEPLGSTGLSHMLEHMTYKHTDAYGPGDFQRIVNSAGGVMNGFTTTYYTGYFENFAKDRYGLGLKLEAARMGRCVFPDSEFESEHQVVSEERRIHDNMPTAQFQERFVATALLADPERNPTIGWSDNVKHYTIPAVRDWYVKYYNPADAVLSVAGDVRPEDVRANAEKYFGGLKGKPVERRDFYNIEPEQKGERRFSMNGHVTMPSMTIGYHVPGIRDSAWYAGVVAANILGGGETSRLFKRLVAELGLATGVSVDGSVERDPSLFTIGVTPRAESLMPRIEQVVQTEIDSAGKGLASEREIQAVRNRVLADMTFTRDNTLSMAYWLATNYILFGTWREAIDYQEHINHVTAEQVRDYCATYLKPDNRTVGILVPAKEEQ